MHQPGDPVKRRVVSEVDVTGRCKQCGAPVTDLDRVKGPTGIFCSVECKERHENFMRRAAQLEAGRPRGGGGLRRLFRKFVGKVFALAVLLAFICALGMFFKIPILSDMLDNIGIIREIKDNFAD